MGLLYVLCLLPNLIFIHTFIHFGYCMPKNFIKKCNYEIDKVMKQIKNEWMTLFLTFHLLTAVASVPFSAPILNRDYDGRSATLWTFVHVRFCPSCHKERQHKILFKYDIMMIQLTICNHNLFHPTTKPLC